MALAEESEGATNVEEAPPERESEGAPRKARQICVSHLDLGVVPGRRVVAVCFTGLRVNANLRVIDLRVILFTRK